MDNNEYEQPTYYEEPQQTKPAVKENPANGLSTAALVIAIISIIPTCCVTGILPVIFAIIALIKGNRSTKTIVALVIGSITFIVWLISFIYSMNHPELMQQYQEQLTQILESAQQAQ